MYKIPANTLFLGKAIHFMPSCHSTNDIAKDLCGKHDTKEGTVVITDYQTSGRGQRGNTWESIAGQNLTFSVLLQPSMINLSQQFYLNMIASLAVKECLISLLPSKNVQVKWPNDVLIDGKKVSGILIENIVKRGGFEWSVLGIGLNVNQVDFINPRATSIKVENGLTNDLLGLWDQLLHQLERYYLKLKSQSYADLKSHYLQSLIGFKELRRYLAEYEFEGEIIDVLESGHLVIRSKQKIYQFDFKEVEFLLN